MKEQPAAFQTFSDAAVPVAFQYRNLLTSRRQKNSHRGINSFCEFQSSAGGD